MSCHSSRKNFGFTLLELLVVVAIIAILTTFGAASYSRIQANSRDTQRRADLAKIRGALEQYYSDNNSYPQNAANYNQMMMYLTMYHYLKTKPIDPQNNGIYIYAYSASPPNPQTFELCANLETGGARSAHCNGNYNYWVTPTD